MSRTWERFYRELSADLADDKITEDEARDRILERRSDDRKYKDAS